MPKKVITSQVVLDAIAKGLPEFFPRAAVTKLTNGLLSSKTLTNLNHHKQGPTPHYVGRKAVYMRDEFMEWLTDYYGGMNVYHDGTCLRVHSRSEEEDGVGEGS